MDHSTSSLPAYILSLPEQEKQHLFRGMVKTIENIMRTAYIQAHRNLLPFSNEQTKGYIPYSDIFKLAQFSNYLQSVDLRPFFQEEHETMCELLMMYIKRTSRVLWANPGGIRLLSVHGIDKIFPVCFQNYDHSNNCLNFEDLLAQFSSITNIQYNKEDGWAIVYTNEPEKLIQLDQYKWYDAENNQECQMRVVTEQCLERAKESFLEISAYMKHSEMYRATVTEVMPCVRTLKSIKVRNADTLENAIVEELVSFSTPKEQYKSCCVQSDGTFLVTFAEDRRINDSEEYIWQEQQSGQ